MPNITDVINARKARYLFTKTMYDNRILNDISAGDCLKGNLTPGDNSTFVDDSNLPLDNEVQAIFMIELSAGFEL